MGLTHPVFTYKMTPGVTGESLCLPGRVKLPLELQEEGALARIHRFRRKNKRCPAKDFLDECVADMVKKFKGSFRALTIMGSEYRNDQRFKALTGKGKPLWEFKEFDHRLYCARFILRGNFVEVVLLNGWCKDKKGKSREEPLQVERAVLLYEEYMDERGQP